MERVQMGLRVAQPVFCDGLFSRSQWRNSVLAALCMLEDRASTVLLLWFVLLTVVNIYLYTG